VKQKEQIFLADSVLDSACCRRLIPEMKIDGDSIHEGAELSFILLRRVHGPGLEACGFGPGGVAPWSRFSGNQKFKLGQKSLKKSSQ
jgi:hypothetical protein